MSSLACFHIATENAKNDPKSCINSFYEHLGEQTSCDMANMAAIVAYLHIQQTRSNVSMNLESCLCPSDSFTPLLALFSNMSTIWTACHLVLLGAGKPITVSSSKLSA